MENAQYHLDMEVRDYECDLQGIVNNARYQHYLEHARHCFLRENGISFAEVTARGIYLIVTRIEIDYKAPLRAGDRFTVGLVLERLSRIRCVFKQEITLRENGRTAIRASVFTAAMNKKGRPVRFPPDLEALISGTE